MGTGCYATTLLNSTLDPSLLVITTASYTTLQVCRRHRLRECTVLLLFASLLLQSATAVAPPAWWTAQQVLAPGASSDDYALANIGQLKTIAKKAAQQMNTILLPEGGAGAPINALVQSWQGSSGQDRDDYSIVTIGQVKTVAQLFYTRLGITPPWEGSSRPQDDYAAANIGQIKTAFAFPIVLSGPPIVRTFPTQPAGGFQIPAPAFNAAARLWAGLASTPAGSSVTDFDGDGIPNDQEYRMSLADPVKYPMSKAMIDPDDWDGDGLLNTEERYQTSLSPLNFADAMQDADGDGLVNYDEIKLLVAGYNTDYLTPTSIRDSHQPRDPDSGASPPDFLIPPDCPLTDGQILRWRRDIARSDFIPGTPGGDVTDESTGTTTHIDPTYPAPAPDTYRVWEDLDDPPNNLPDGYDLWLAQLPAGDTNPNTPAGPDVDADAMPNLWEHRYRLAFYDASNAGNASQWLIPQVLQVRSSFSDADYATLLGTIPHFDDLLRWNASIMAHEASQDPDHDTSVNLREYLASTNPLLADSDGDGYRDDVETTLGSDPAVYSDSPKKYPLVLTILSGTGQSGHAGSTLISPLKVKAERNGLPSVGEVLTFSSTQADFSSSHSSPLVLQAAADGTVTTTCTFLLTAPAGPITVTVSGDGADATYTFTATPAIFVMTPTGLMPDDDSDGMPDAWEIQMFGNLSQSAKSDFDHDGLSNLDEWKAGTNATVADTDGDGYNDNLEQQWQSSPTLASSTPITSSSTFLTSIKSYDSQSVNASDAWVVNTNVDPREGTYYWSSHYRDFLGDFDQFHSEKSRFNVNVSGWPVDGVPDSCWKTDTNQDPARLPHGTSFGRYWNWSNVPEATALAPQTTYTGKDLLWNRCRIRLSTHLPFDLKETCLRVKTSYMQDERGNFSGAPPVTTFEQVELVVPAQQLLGDWLDSSPTAVENELVTSYLLPPVTIDSRDRAVTGTIPNYGSMLGGGKKFEVAFQAGATQLGRYEIPKYGSSQAVYIYNGESEIFSDEEVAKYENKTLDANALNQPVVLVRDGEGVRFYTVADNLGEFKITLYYDGGQMCEISRNLTEEQDFARLIAAVEAFVAGDAPPEIRAWEPWPNVTQPLPALPPLADNQLSDALGAAPAAVASEVPSIQSLRDPEFFNAFVLRVKEVATGQEWAAFTAQLLTIGYDANAALAASAAPPPTTDGQEQERATASSGYPNAGAVKTELSLPPEIRNRGMVARVVIYWVKRMMQTQVATGEGIVFGLWDGVKGDAEGFVDMFRTLGQVFSSPWKTASELYHTFKSLKDLTFDQVKAKVQGLFDSFLTNQQERMEWVLEGESSDRGYLIAYMGGYLGGYIGEQVLVTIGTAGLSKGKYIARAISEGKQLLKGLSITQKIPRNFNQVFSRYVRTADEGRGVSKFSNRCTKGNCFTGGTLVLMADGSSKVIENVERGEWIIADDPNDHEPPKPAKVEWLIRNRADRLYTLEWDCTGDGITDAQVRTTSEHPFFAVGRGWTAARDLLPGDHIQTHLQRTVTVTSNHAWICPSATYNLDVGEPSTYFVGDEKSWLLVHNIEYEIVPWGIWSTPNQNHHGFMNAWLSEHFPTTYLGRMWEEDFPCVELSPDNHSKATAVERQFRQQRGLPPFGNTSWKDVTPQEAIKLMKDSLHAAGAPDELWKVVLNQTNGWLKANMHKWRCP